MDIFQHMKKFGGKIIFFDELKDELDIHSADDLVMCFGDINGHIGRTRR